MQSEITLRMSEGVYLVRLDTGLIVYTNAQFEAMFGYETGEMVGMSHGLQLILLSC